MAHVVVCKPGDPDYAKPQQLSAKPTDLNLRGEFHIEHIRNGQTLRSFKQKNGIVNEGKNRLLDVMFHATTAHTAWFLGLIDNANFTALANDDIYDDINQAGNDWDEFTSYTDGNNSNNATTRPAWPEDAASGQAITNSSVAVYNITATGTVKGVFLVAGTNAQTKGDHTAGSSHCLWATALFSSGDVPVLNADQLKVTYTVSA